MNEKADTTADATEAADIPMRILRVATCPSLSERSELTYHVGCDKANAVHFRTWANVGGNGMFGNMWVSMAEISNALSALDTFASSALAGVFEATSRNNCGFHLAHLLSEGLIEKSPDKQRTYRTANPAPFLERINALIASGVELHEDDAPSDAVPMSAVAVPKRGRPKKQAA